MAGLDFIVIGAAKSGTTTLFELAKDHPEIAMPKEKEVPFYDEEEVRAKGMDWYLRTYFVNASSTQKRGTITPQYMLGKGDTSPKDIAVLIHQDSPKVKIVAILRDPIERAYSHYQMFAQRGHFKQTFEESVELLLKDDKLDNLRKTGIADNSSFLLGSEYGRILLHYYALFDKKDILVFSTDDLKVQPAETLRTFLNFIGVDDTYRPDTLGAEFRKGGAKPRIKLLTPGVIFKIPLVEYMWKHFTPYSLRKKVEYRLNLWNIKPGNAKLDKTSETYNTLLQFYQNDVALLIKEVGITPAWAKKYVQSKGAVQ